MVRTKIPCVRKVQTPVIPPSSSTPSSQSTPIPPSSNTNSIQSETNSSRSSITPSRRSSRIKTSTFKALGGPGSKISKPIIVNDDSESTISEKLESSKPSSAPKRNTGAPTPPPSKKPKINIKYSSNKGKGKMVEEETQLKKDEEIQPSAVFDREKWDKGGIMSGRIYLLDEMKNSGWNLSPLIEEQGWEKLLSQDEVIFPELVKEFYGSMNVSQGKTSFTTHVKGTTLIVNPTMLAIAL